MSGHVQSRCIVAKSQCYHHRWPRWLMLQGDFRLETEALEPDPDVLDLGQELIDMEQIASQTLSDEDRA